MFLMKTLSRSVIQEKQHPNDVKSSKHTLWKQETEIHSDLSQKLDIGRVICHICYHDI